LSTPAQDKKRSQVAPLKLLFESGSPGRSGIDWATEGGAVAESIPAHLLRGEIDGFPELGELEVVRHFTGLSQRNF
jgi:glycine dehydrogenase subunit 2